jgi:hypothetical protein
VAAPIGALPDAAAAEVHSYGFDGDNAGALFQSFDGCVQRTALIMPMKGRTRDNISGATREASVLLQLAHFDMCRFNQSFRFGVVDLVPGDFRVRGDLGTATLRGRVGMTDWMTGDPVSIDLDVTWRATERGQWEREGSHVRDEEGGLDIYRGRGMVRAAAASGTVMEGSYSYAWDQESLFGNISSTKGGRITITR